MFDSVKLWELIAKYYFTQIKIICFVKFENICPVRMVKARKIFQFGVIFLTLEHEIWPKSWKVLQSTSVCIEANLLILQFGMFLGLNSTTVLSRRLNPMI